MAFSIEDFIKRIGAEIVGGKLIIGEMLERRHIGTLAPALELTDEGKELFAATEKQAADEIVAKGKSGVKKAAAPLSLSDAVAGVAALKDSNTPATDGAKE